MGIGREAMQDEVMAKSFGSKLNDDLEIEAQIQRELDALGEDELGDDAEEDSGLYPYNALNEDLDKSVNICTSEVDKYLALIKCDEEKASQNIFEAEQILVQSEKGISTGINELFEGKLREELETNGEEMKHENLLQLRSEVFAEIEELELEEEKEFARTSLETNNLALDIVRPDIVEEIKQFEKEEKEKLKRLRERQREEEKNEAELAKKRKESEILLEDEAKQRSLQRMKALKKAKEEFQEKEINICAETEHERMSMREIEETFQREIKEMEELRQEEAKKYLKMKEKIETERQRKRMDAALIIQKKFRGFRTRRNFEPQLKKLKTDRIARKMQLLEETERQEKLQKEAEELKRKQEEHEIFEKKLEMERKEKERLEIERIEKERLEKERLEKERLEKERLERERLEKERLDKERLEKERLKKERLEKERLERERLEKERLEKERLTKERLKKERLEKEKLEKEKLEKERLTKERLEKERLEKERLEKERLEKERFEKERLEREEKERLEKERLQKERLEKERLEMERLEKERLKKERLEKERLENERVVKEKANRERMSKNELEQKSAEIETKQSNGMRLDKRIEEGQGKRKLNCDRAALDKESLDVSSKAQDLDPKILAERIEKKRQEWVDAHSRYSESTTVTRKQSVARTRPRTNYRKRGSSIAAPDLATDEILRCAPSSVSLQTVECIYVADLNSVGLTSLKACPNLRVANVQNCGVQALEGIDGCEKIEKINLCRNKIDSLRLPCTNNLREILLSDNNLSSVNGLDSLSNLQVLDLSLNRITRIGSLSSCTSIQDLDISSNQLISLKGLESLQRLVSLKAAKNHLASAKEVEHLPLLAFLDLTGNTIQAVPSLKNHVLLRSVILDENNVTSLDQLSDFWLPSLIDLSLSGNSIESLPQLDHLLMLEKLDVRDNLIRESEKLFPDIEHCPRLSTLNVSGNPVEGIPDFRWQIQTRLKLVFLDDCKLEEPPSIADMHRSHFENLCLNQRKKQNDLKETHEKNLKELEKVPDLYNRQLKTLDAEKEYRRDRFKMGLTHLYQHEFFGEGGKCDERGQDFKEIEKAFSISQKAAESEHGTDKESGTDKKDGTDTKDGTDELQSGVTHGMKSNDDQTSESQINTEKVTTSDVKKSDPLKSQPTEQSSEWKATQIQAATRIQALFRGYRLRCALYAALTAARGNGAPPDEDDFDYDEEVDLSAFDYDDGNRDWKPASSSHLPTSPPLQAVHDNEEEKMTRFAWQSQPRTPDLQSQNVERLNLDFSPEESEATMTIPESGANRKQDEIRMEWGFHNTSTADLMMKRAKKMNAAARKKNMMTMAPDKRYALFKKIQETNPNLTVRPPSKKKTSQRVEYFAARKDSNSQMSLSSFSTERDFKQEMTYSWVCNQTVLHTDAHHDIIPDQAQDTQPKAKKKTHNLRTKESVSLPYMDPAIIAGKNVPLVILSSRDPNSNSESPKRQRSPSDPQGKQDSNEKSKSAPNPSDRTAHLFGYLIPGTTRSSSSESGRGKQRKAMRKR